jgi:hypothetical protein
VERSDRQERDTTHEVIVQAEVTATRAFASCAANEELKAGLQQGGICHNNSHDAEQRQPAGRADGKIDHMRLDLTGCKGWF